jgi:UDP-N-acetylmuramate--alanine ligase
LKRRVHRVHLVGIGGVGMSGLAEILQATGYAVSGSDLHEGETVRRLRALGVEVSIGHAEANLGAADVVVYSAAIRAANPELRAAEAAHIPVIARAEMLAELMRLKFGIAIAGSHGKTTTTSLVGAVLQAGDLDPTIVVGGRVHSLGSNSRHGAGDVFVAEADESDGSFLALLPSLVVVTNIDREHLDHYGDLERLRGAFADFANRVPFYGAAILCLDDPGVRALLPDVTRRVTTYGLSPQADLAGEAVEVVGWETRFRARASGTPLGEFRLRLPGLHYARNALAAIAVGLELDVPIATIREALAEFAGVARRFELRGQAGGVQVIDDYAHHPTEIRATLDAARRALDGRLIVAFQPHRYTRTRDLFDELASAFHEADSVLITEVYAAGEDKIPGADAEALAEASRRHGHRAVRFVREREDVVPALLDQLQPGDAVLFMGAGDLGQLAEPLLARLEGGSAD